MCRRPTDAARMASPLRLFIDFDGVICDSAAECLFSSWAAYDRLARSADAGAATVRPPAAPRVVPIALRQRFMQLRPFIRAGDDYVLIQHLLAAGRMPSRQEEFDRARRDAGPRALDRYADALNRVRQELMAHDRDHWLRLNPLYPGMAALLRAADWETTSILSTKRPTYIAAILDFHAVAVPPQAILHAAAASKLEIVSMALNERQGGRADGRAALVDDQLDHLIGNDDERIEVYLADWGYARPEWLDDPRVPALSRTGLADLSARARTGGAS